MILVTLLTSSGIEFLEESINSFFGQKDVNLDEFKLLIVVNTFNDNYFKEVSQKFGNKLQVVRTQSNGKPGKGHNSLIDIFSCSTNFDYLIPIDGDDFLYPYALKRICMYIEYKPDVLFLPYNDIIGSEYTGQTLSMPIHGKLYLSYNNYVTDMKNQWVTQKLNPFTNKIERCNTPGRLILLSRNGLNLDIRYDENLKWYDDFIIFLKCFESIMLRDNYRIFMLDDKEIYLYNRINEDSVSDKFKINYDENVISERINFENSIKNKFLAIRHWDLSKVVFLKLDDEDNFCGLDKLLFTDSLIESLDKNLNISKYKPVTMNYENLKLFKDYAVEKNINEMIDLYSYLTDKYLN